MQSRKVREALNSSGAHGEGQVRDEYHKTKKDVIRTQRHHGVSSSGDAVSSAGSEDRRSGGGRRVLVRPSAKRAEVDFVAANK